jgi:hypothetical protein
VLDSISLLALTLRASGDDINLRGDGRVDLEEDLHQVARQVVRHVVEDACQEALLVDREAVGHEVEGHDVEGGDAEGDDAEGHGAGVMGTDIDRMEGVEEKAGRDAYGCLFRGRCDYGENGSHDEAEVEMETVVSHDEVSFRVASSMEVRLLGRRDPKASSKLWRPHCVQLLVLCCTES